MVEFKELSDFFKAIERRYKFVIGITKFGIYIYIYIYLVLNMKKKIKRKV